MDVLYSLEDEMSGRGVYKEETIRYGDLFCFGNCASNAPALLAIVRHRIGKRSPSVLPVDIAAPGQYADSDYMWTFVPAPGTKRRCGDPISFGDRVRIQTIDYLGNCRYLIVNPDAPRVVQAEKAPCGRGKSTWFVTYASRLRKTPDGCLLPDGERKAHVEFGKSNYVALINDARYLGARTNPYGELRGGACTLPDLPASGAAVWWRLDRRPSDARR